MKKLLLPAAMVALCVSCAPPFDLGFSSAAVIIGKMTRESQVGPITDYWTGYYSSAPVFFPEKTATGVDTTRGFYLTTDAGNSMVFLGFVQPDGLGGYVSFATGIGSLYQQDPNYPTFTVVPVKAGDYAAVIGFDSNNVSNGAVVILQASAATKSFTGTSVQFSSYFGTPSGALGASVLPSAAASDTLFSLMRDTSTIPMLHDMETAVSSTASPSFTDSSGAQSMSFIPPGANRVMYFHDPDPARNASYASFYDGKAWQCWKWWYNAGIIESAQLTGVASRIDTVLTTGELFSTQGGIGRVYDPDGTPVTSFPLGKFTFAYEEYVNGTARMFFSMPIEDRDNHISFAVYSIATAQLRSLSYY